MHVDSISRTSLLAGSPGTEQTLSSMAALVRRDSSNLLLRQKALDLVSTCEGHNFQCEIDTIFHYCRDEIVYRRDPVHAEWVQDAARTIGVFGSGDCDDKVVCLATLLSCLGHKSRFVVVGSSGRKFTHVYLEVETRGGWLPLDPTPEEAPLGWEVQGLYKSTYDIFNEGGDGMLLLALGIAAYFFFLR